MRLGNLYAIWPCNKVPPALISLAALVSIISCVMSMDTVSVGYSNNAYSTAEFLMYTCPGDVKNNSGNAKPTQRDPSSSPTKPQSGKANLTRKRIVSIVNSSRSCCKLSSSQSLRNSTASFSSTSRGSSPKRCARLDVAELVYCVIVLAAKKRLSQCMRSTETARDPTCILLPLLYIKMYKDIRFDPMINTNVIFPNCTNKKEMFDIARQTFSQCELDRPLKPRSRSLATTEKLRHPLEAVFLAKFSLHMLSRPQDMLFSTHGGSAPLPCWEPDLREAEYLYRQNRRWDVDSRCIDVVASVLRRALISATNRIVRVSAIKNSVSKHSSAKAMFVFNMSTSFVEFRRSSFLQIEFRAIVRRFKMEAAKRSHMQGEAEPTRASCKLRGRRIDVIKSVNLVVGLMMANELALQHHRLFSVLEMSLINTLYKDGLNDAF
eukprot:scpid65642/ scgid7291/ 